MANHLVRILVRRRRLPFVSSPLLVLLPSSTAIGLAARTTDESRSGYTHPVWWFPRPLMVREADCAWPSPRQRQNTLLPPLLIAISSRPAASPEKSSNFKTDTDAAPATLYINDNGSLELAMSNHHNPRTCHIRRQHHFIRDAVKRRETVIAHVNTAQKTANALTRGSPASVIYRMP
ncbi:MAG: hypothetical protein BJ554DRAFT_721 [Olpidium bornovanus]|uniref:Uncharacterized protein n=1 Tax=Olpidium bornovanus TaxID=278681 RepID=A0A8H8DHY2_9FUNG|nr:MAG: hypothetical protein BJ554DRAFT_721 [Olpidium bornovanus]